MGTKETQGHEPNLKELKGALAPCYGCQNEKGGCQEGCPTGLPLDQIRRLVVDNGVPGLDAAAEIATNRNPLGLACTSACDPCQAEEGCRNRLSSPPMQELHRFVARHFQENSDGFEINTPKPNGKKVAVVGDGPAALTTAIKLAASGTKVTIFSGNVGVGGLLNDIPRVKDNDAGGIDNLLDKFVDADRIEVLEESGQISPEDPLEKEFDGIVVATGLEYKVPKEFESPHAKHAVEFIKENRYELGHPLQGQRVMIIGGGKTAVDAATRAKELGAAEVEVIYRRDLGSMDEYQKLVKEGITIKPLLEPEEAGASKASEGMTRQGQGFENEDYVRFKQMKLVEIPMEIDGSFGRKRPTDKTGFTETHRANLILWATPGDVMSDKTAEEWKAKGVPVEFAGDVRSTGEKTVAKAVKSGMDAANSMLTELGVEEQPIIRHPVVNTSAEFIAGQSTKTPFMVAAVPTSDAANIEACRAALSQDGCSGIVIKTTSFDDKEIEFPDGYMVATESGGQVSGMGNADHISRAGITKALDTATVLKQEFPDKKIIVSIMSPRLRDWGVLAKMIKDAGLDGVECSFSCPQGNLKEKAPGEESDDAKFMKELGIENVEGYGSMLGQNIAQSRAAAISMVRAVGPDFPVSIKIPTSNTPFTDVVKKLYAEGIRYFTCANSVHGAVQTDLGGNGEVFAPGEEGKFATVGYTGRGITPASLASVLTLAELKTAKFGEKHERAGELMHPGLKIWGTGGMMTGKDAIAMLAAGADGVQFGTGIIERGAKIFEEAKLVLEYYCHRYGVAAMDIINSTAGWSNFDALVKAKEGRRKQGIHLVAEHDEDQCVDCGNCATTCNDGMHGAVVAGVKGEKPHTNPDKCEGCGACAGLCPTGAIRMERVEK